MNKQNRTYKLLKQALENVKRDFQKVNKSGIQPRNNSTCSDMYFNSGSDKALIKAYNLVSNYQSKESTTPTLALKFTRPMLPTTNKGVNILSIESCDCSDKPDYSQKIMPRKKATEYVQKYIKVASKILQRADNGENIKELIAKKTERKKRTNRIPFKL